jgi:hypothetical protein
MEMRQPARGQENVLEARETREVEYKNIGKPVEYAEMNAGK